MFFSRLLKNFLIALGFLLIGFGLGLVVSKNFQIEKNQYWLIMVSVLILGGFFSALGLVKRIPKEREIKKIEKFGEIKSPEEKVETGEL